MKYNINYITRKAIYQGNKIELLLFEKYCISKSPTVFKLDAERFVILSTGEVKEYNKSDFKTDAGIRRTVTNLRRLINCNFFGAKNELFVTLTYAENMTDSKRLYSDFDKFMKRLKYAYPSTEFVWINAVEPQERGAFHCHVLLRSLNENYLYINNKTMAKLWSHGFTTTKRLTNNSNVGAYLSSYLLNTKNKKGGRLHLYPKNMRLYRSSRNCSQPIIKFLNKSEYKRLVDTKTLTYTKELSIKDDNGQVVNHIKKMYLV